MNKLLTVFEAPVKNRSGYGSWADDLAHCLANYSPSELVIVPTPWGSCATRFSKEAGDEIIDKHIIKERLPKQPEVHISHTLPHMGQIRGKFNINITAGIEVDKVYPRVNEAINLHDLTIVPCHFAKEVFLNSHPKITKPIEVLPWGGDKITPTAQDQAKVDAELAKIKEKEIFLYVGQITTTNFSTDRKNIGGLVKTFLEAFANHPQKPALVLKCGGANASLFDRNQTLEIIKAIKGFVPDTDVEVYLLHGELSEGEMAALFSHPRIIANITFSRGEGWGQPMFQATLAGKPVIATNHSGHLDFLGDKFIPLAGNLIEIPPQAVSEYFPAGSRWYEVDTRQAKKVLLDFFYNDRTRANQQAQDLAKFNEEKYNLSKMQYRLHKILNNYIKL